jgi:hypothetical protein
VSQSGEGSLTPFGVQGLARLQEVFDREAHALGSSQGVAVGAGNG